MRIRFTDPADGEVYVYTQCGPDEAPRVFACNLSSTSRSTPNSANLASRTPSPAISAHPPSRGWSVGSAIGKA